MPSPEIEEFAKALVAHIRDAAVRSCDAYAKPDASIDIAKRWKSVGASAEVLREVIPDIVDEAVFWLLHAIDDGLLPLKFVGSTGEEIDLRESGELAGWYMSTGGWRAMFSSERHVDYDVDMAR
jgi:hypothetical protein